MDREREQYIRQQRRTSLPDYSGRLYALLNFTQYFDNHPHPPIKSQKKLKIE
jgi:hypothetical protein